MSHNRWRIGMSSICLGIYRQGDILWVQAQYFYRVLRRFSLIACVKFVQNNSILKSVLNDQETNDTNRNRDFMTAPIIMRKKLKITYLLGYREKRTFIDK